MRAKLRLILLALTVALVSSACAVPQPTPAEGPSQFLAGFNLPAVVASINGTPSGPHCLNNPPGLSSTHSPRDSAFGGWTIAFLTTSCSDPGDGTQLAQAWGDAITAELARLGAQELGKVVGTTATGAKITSEWEYLSSGLRGQITVGVLPAPEGQFWVILRIFEPS